MAPHNKLPSITERMHAPAPIQANASRLLRSRWISVAVIVAVSVLMLVWFAYLVLVDDAQRQAMKTSRVLVDQVERIIKSNEEKQIALTSSLKEDYMTRARAIAYVVDEKPSLENDLKELNKIARLMSVDEIHLFDESGTIRWGTVPKYYGYSFDSGEQMAYFKPMLSDKSLAMCQDMTPNTAEAKPMMYAICWNEKGTRMIQVGIEPTRLISEMHTSAISEIVRDMPAYVGVNIFVANAASGRIEGATLAADVGKTLSEVGLAVGTRDINRAAEFEATVGGEPCYVVMHRFAGHIVACTYSVRQANGTMITGLVMLLMYLLAAGALIAFTVRRMTARLMDEQRNATTDQMTELLNRRAYEDTARSYERAPLEKNLVYVSLDLNGLKRTNDTLGHDAGDKLIRGAAQCMRQCFGNYGQLYRVGGDEFVALIFADNDRLERIRMDFRNTLAEWSSNNDMELTISCGFVPVRQCPDKTFAQIAKLADMRMYGDKKRHYSHAGTTA